MKTAAETTNYTRSQHMTDRAGELTDLHAQIMNLPCKPDTQWPDDERWGYREGHRDARHAAAELATHAAAIVEELQQQLATVRLLARAFVQARLEVNGWKGEDVVLEAWIPNGQHADGDELINREFWRTQIQDGLPVLCDAWRVALQKAIGET
jgi:hypothetical protein